MSIAPSNFSGAGTFTGPGTANPTKLFIPQKEQMDGPSRTMAQTLETFINSLNTPPTAASVDRLVLTTSFSLSGGGFDPINWTGATVNEHVGTSLSIVGGNIVTNNAGVYGITLQANTTTAGTGGRIFFLDWFTSAITFGLGYLRFDDTTVNPVLWGEQLTAVAFSSAGNVHQLGAGVSPSYAQTMTVQLIFQRIS